VSPREFPNATTIQRLSIEMDNLQAAADWLMSRERWTSLLELARHLFGYGFVISPINAGTWYRTALKHAVGIDLQMRVDALGELSYLDYGAGLVSASDAAESSIALADEAALLHSPWAWNTRILTAFGHVDAATAKTAKTAIEAVLGIAQERDDEFAVLFALGMAAVVPTLEGDYAQSTKLADEALRRARAIANPAAVTMVVAVLVSGYLTMGVNPDFAGGIAFLEANPVDPDANTPTSTLWLNFEWGIGLLGEGRLLDAVTPLTRAMRLADTTYPSAQPDVLRALAVALGEAGHADLATQLDGYAQTNFAAHPPLNATHIWLQPRLTAIEQHLDDTERAAAHATGAALDRRSFMRLLAGAEDRIATRTSP
jgi:hypothetical protein